MKTKTKSEQKKPLVDSTHTPLVRGLLLSNERGKKLQIGLPIDC